MTINNNLQCFTNSVSLPNTHTHTHTHTHMLMHKIAHMNACIHTHTISWIHFFFLHLSGSYPSQNLCTRGEGFLNLWSAECQGHRQRHTGKKTKDTHPVSGKKLKSLTPPGLEPRPPGRKAEILPTEPKRRTITS